MSEVLERRDSLLALWRTGIAPSSLATLVGEEPRHIRLDRVHFPGKRPIQLNFSVRLRSGLVVPVLAEHCPEDTQVHATRITASLMKSRNGQRAGLARSGIVADVGTGLVLRRPGLDERLPGLRLLYDASTTREIIARATGRDPGTVSVRLVAHRLGKRAVLRITTPGGDVYARLRPIKSGDGAERLARHKALWDALRPNAGLCIPEPLGTASEIGLSLFGALPGTAPDFRRSDCHAIVRALSTLRAIDLDGLPRHSGRDEAQLLHDWLDRCKQYRPEFARVITPRLQPTLDRLDSLDSEALPCHRDLHEKQILISGGTAGILDFDTLSLAHPALDPGNLSAHLFLARQDERPLRGALERPGFGLWRRAALYRLAMIYAFTSMPDAEVERLVTEASSIDHD